MNIKEYFWERSFKPKDFYYNILEENYPKGYEKDGEYYKSIFLCYDYSSDLVHECVKTFEELKNNNFAFVNMQYAMVFHFSKVLGYDYRCLLDFYKQTYINKDYQNLYRVWEELNKFLLKNYNTSNSNDFITLTLLLTVYNTNIISIKDLYRYNDYQDLMFAMSVFKALTIKY